MDRSPDDSLSPAAATAPYHGHAAVPDYLMRHYWWAYVHPKAPWVFDRLWLINLILLCNYNRMRRQALAEFEAPQLGRILQIACAYGDLTPKLAKQAAKQDGQLDVIDVLPVQLRTLKWKLPKRAPARLMRMDSTALHLPDASYDKVLIFFLLHEQPVEVRAETIREALRVLKPDGTLVICDYGTPAWWNPLRYLMPPFLAVLEPFALSLMRQPLKNLLPPDMTVRHTPVFGGFYQKVVATRKSHG
jgi:ubiquinone/menaquinone biosynthesis C-methylase UbiE